MCRDAGITSYRGAYEPTRFVRLARLVSMDNLNTTESMASEFPFNIRGSLFFEPFREGAWARVHDELQFRRMQAEMLVAARHGLSYHLWWHPDNFGTHIKRNVDRLRRFLAAFARIRERYGMESLNMAELAGRLQVFVDRDRAEGRIPSSRL